MNIGARVQVKDTVEYSSFSYREMKGHIIKVDECSLAVVRLDNGEIYPFWLNELNQIGVVRNLPEWF